MSALALIWIASLATMVGVAWYGGRVARVGANVSPIRLSDLATREARLLLRDAVNMIDDMRPHGVRALRNGLVFVRRGQDFFIARVYGKMKVHKGGVTSFFLKQIAEHKGQDGGRSAGSREM